MAQLTVIYSSLISKTTIYFLFIVAFVAVAPQPTFASTVQQLSIKKTNIPTATVTPRDEVNYIKDSDNDCLPDVYELGHGLDPNNPGDSGYDTDGDGVSNLDEYNSGTELNDAESYPNLFQEPFPITTSVTQASESYSNDQSLTDSLNEAVPGFSEMTMGILILIFLQIVFRLLTLFLL